jgi:hypothetical protein
MRLEISSAECCRPKVGYKAMKIQKYTELSTGIKLKVQNRVKGTGMSAIGQQQ